MATDTVRMEQPSCEARIDGELQSRLEDMAAILRRDERASASDYEDGRERNMEEWSEYPLSVEVTRLITIQLSWGGPSDEFEVEIDSDGVIVAMRYRFKDWWDGAVRELRPDSEEWRTAERFLSYFTEVLE